MEKKILILITVVFVCTFFVGCFVTSGVQRGFTGSEVGSKMKAKFDYFDGDKYKKISFKKGEKFIVNYNIDAEEGKIELTFIDNEGNELLKKDSGDGKEVIEIQKDGKYTVKVTGTKAKGDYSVSWRN